MKNESLLVQHRVLDCVRVQAQPHPFEMPIGATALLVIDMQNDFCAPDGFCCGDMGLEAAAVRAIVPALQNMTAWARENGVPIFWTKEAHRPDLSDVSPSKKVRYENAGYPVGATGKRGRYLVQGEWGARIIDELAPPEDELQIAKPAQSAFPATALETTLRERGVTHLLISGVTTQCCVLATYRQANDLGFFALLLEDCCAAFEPREHQAAVDVVLSENGAVGWVSTSEHVLNAY